MGGRINSLPALNFILMYNLMYVDVSWLLTRNISILTKGLEPEDYDSCLSDVLRLTIQTLAKMFNENSVLRPDKIIMISDKWEDSLGGYYRTYLLKDCVKYKGSRLYVTQQDLEAYEKRDDKSEEQLKKFKHSFYFNKVRSRAKEIMKEEFPKFGLMYYCKPGYEFDDIATIASFTRANRTDGKKDIIVTVDTDLGYSLSPACDWFQPKVGNRMGRFFTYQDMVNKMPPGVKNKITLYQFHSYHDALGFGHNDMAVCKRSYITSEYVIGKILQGDFSDVLDMDTFKAQLKTFDLPSFPKYDEVVNDIKTLFENQGSYPSLEKFRDFCNTWGVTKISDKYFSDFTQSFDRNLYDKY